jgi:kynureninase
MIFENTLAFAQQLDKQDPLAHFRDKFYLPQHNNKPVIYLCGNSLGLQPKGAQVAVQQEFDDWVALLKRTNNEDLLKDPYNIWLEAWCIAKMKKDPDESGSKGSS